MALRSEGNSATRKETRSSVLKVLILGDGAVGKSCIMTRFINNQFEDNSFHTIGVEFLNKDITVDNKTYTLQIWDTAGQERFKTLRTPFYRGTDVCLLVFAIDDKSSFDSLSLWRQEFLHYGDIQNPDNFPFIVIGNKVDLGDTAREVDKEEPEKWCSYHGMIPYFETSAKEAINVQEVFQEAVRLWSMRESALDALLDAEKNTVNLLGPRQKTQNQRRCC